MSKRIDHPQTRDDLPSKSSTTNHRIIVNNLLNAVRKQENIMEHLLRDLEFFRK